MSHMNNDNLDAISAFDEAYVAMFESTINFFRFVKRNPQFAEQLEVSGFADEYYRNVADAMKRRIDHEINVAMPSKILK